MANPLDMVTQDQSVPADADGMRRVYINTGPPAPDGAPDVVPSSGNKLVQAVAPERPNELAQGLAAIRDWIANGQFSPGTKVGNKLFGTGGEERYQTWPERMARSGATLAGDVMSGAEPTRVIDPDTGEETLSLRMIGRSLDMAGLAGGSALIERPGAATLGSGPVRPAPVIKPTEPAPIFYSALEHAATNAAQETMSPQQWLGYLKNQPGVKKEELDWSGLEGWLGQQKGKVKKEDVQGYLDAHKTEIKDVTKSEANAPEFINSDDWADMHGELTNEIMARRHGAEWENKYDVDHPEFEHAEREADAELARRNVHPEHLEGEEHGQGPKYSGYQLPGGENYREHLLMMPEKIDPSQYQAVKHGEFWDVKDKSGQLLWRERAKDGPDAIRLAVNDLGLEGKGGSYRSSHWDEPNVLAHVRTNDRMMEEPGFRVVNPRSGNASGYFKRDEAEAYQNALPEAIRGQTKVTDKAVNPVKSLHIEEIQSDWHQQGRKQGYRPEQEKKLAELVKQRDEMQKEAKELSPGDDRYKEIYKELPKLQTQINEIGSSNVGVPDAPFKTTWPELALKRMIRHAAENGYDRISWTPGEAQAARYDLSKQVNRIEYEHNPNTNKYHVAAWDKNNSSAINKHVTKDELPGLIGKELADKIVKGEGKAEGAKQPGHKYFEGVDLKVGGEGMREFYDKMLPKMAEKIGKAHGVRVKQTDLSPPEYRIAEASEGSGGGWNVNNAVGEQVYHYARRQDAEAFVKDLAPPRVHYFDLPQSLKDTALHKGFPLYMQGVPFPLTPVDHDPFKRKERK